MSIRNPNADFIAHDTRAVTAAVAAQTALPERPAARGEYGRAFDLPPILHALTVAGYLGFLGVMAIAFMAPDLAIPITIFALFVVAGFGTPALWARIAPPPAGRKLDWNALMQDGFECATGQISGAAAATQVLILPGLILLWGVAVALIGAWVR